MFISARIIPLVTANEITHTEQISVSNGNGKLLLISCFCVFLKTYLVFALICILKTLLMGTCMNCVYKTLLLMPTRTTGRYFYFECSSAWFVRFQMEICWILNSSLQSGTTDPRSCCCVCFLFKK